MSTARHIARVSGAFVTCSSGDLVAAVLQHVKPAPDFTASAAAPQTPISAATAAFFAEIGAQIRPGISDLLLPTLFACIRSSPCCGWSSEAAVDVIKHVCDRAEDRHLHVFVSALTDEVADNVQQLQVAAVKAAVRVCVTVHTRVRDPANSLPFARLFAVTVDCALQPAWGISAAELQPIVNKFAARVKSLAKSLEMLHGWAVIDLHVNLVPEVLVTAVEIRFRSARPPHACFVSAVFWSAPLTKSPRG